MSRSTVTSKLGELIRLHLDRTSAATKRQLKQEILALHQSLDTAQPVVVYHLLPELVGHPAKILIFWRAVNRLLSRPLPTAITTLYPHLSSESVTLTDTLQDTRG